jgi:hypothetical protein
LEAKHSIGFVGGKNKGEIMMATSTSIAINFATLTYKEKHKDVDHIEKFLYTRHIDPDFEIFVVGINHIIYRVIHDVEEDEWKIDLYNKTKITFERVRNEKGTN